MIAELSFYSIIRPLTLEVAEQLIARNWKLSTAESCTGGGLGHVLTAVSGSSRWFEGGIISYSNRVKQQQLHVPQTLLDEHGAVSKPVAMAMAQGVRQLLETDLAIAVTGIAGPDGGTADKPVGTVWIAWSCAQKTDARHFCFKGDREQIRQQTVLEALQGIKSFVLTVSG